MQHSLSADHLVVERNDVIWLQSGQWMTHHHCCLQASLDDSDNEEVVTDITPDSHEVHLNCQ